MASSKFLIPGIVGAVLVALFLALPFQSPSSANKLDVLDKGPEIGEPIPHQLTTVDQFNNETEFLALKRKNGLILLFSRSFDW